MELFHRYSSDIAHETIAVLGVYPPPYGGVSVHIQRVMNLFMQNRNKVYFFNTEQSLRRFFPVYLVKLFFWLLWRRPTMIYYHSSYSKNFGVELWLLIFMKRMITTQLIIVEHDSRHLYNRSQFFLRWYRKAISQVNHVVCIGVSAYESYQNNNVALASFSIEGAFLPPEISSLAMITASYPSSLFNFVKEFTPIVLVNAAHMMRIEGKDVYGLDQTIDAMAKLKQDFPDMGLIMAIASIDDGEYYDQLKQRMREHKIIEQVYVLQDQKQLWPLFKRVDVFLRPTLSDGASISIQESLYFNVPVVASDSCDRPENVTLFKTNDRDSYANAIKRVLYEKVYATHQRDSVHAKSPR